MLVLTRKIGEGIDIGTIKIEVVQVRGRQVRIGLTCPDDVEVFRSEQTKAERDKLRQLREEKCKTNNPR